MFRFILIGIACVKYYPETWRCRSGGDLVRIFFIGELAFLATVTVLLIFIVNHSSRGSIVDTYSRRYVPALLTVKWVNTAAAIVRTSTLQYSAYVRLFSASGKICYSRANCPVRWKKNYFNTNKCHFFVIGWLDVFVKLFLNGFERATKKFLHNYFCNWLVNFKSNQYFYWQN